ncbi:MAG TPA: PA14 domain-containing protein, partial [Puia sp.]|nr:PA14 domain-containing protein [Puia sp.]
RGLPDDFSGGTDTIKKVSSVKPNNSWGVTAGADVELTGLPLSLGASLGVFHTTYTGWGYESAINASINAGSKSTGTLSGGLSLTNNSQNGVTVNPSLGYHYQYLSAGDNGSASAGVQFSAPYNSRTGLKDIHMGITASVNKQVATGRKDEVGNPIKFGSGTSMDVAGISFAWPSYTPTINMPMTNYNYSFTAKLGGEATVVHPSFYVSGYFGSEYVAGADTALLIPAYGYLNFQNRSGNWAALTDFNREKELPYRESPPVPHIAVPSYTYDIFNISGEGTGGMFRAYRGDIGFIADHLISTKTKSGAASVDLGGGDLVHGGVDLNGNYSVTQTGPWLNENPLRNTINFRPSNGLYEAAYFRNPGEKAINTTDFYNAIGGDHVAVPVLNQNGSSIMTTNLLNLFDGPKQVGVDTLTVSNVVKNTRDKRAEVITYLTAQEAAVSGLDKYINRYTINQFADTCDDETVVEPVGIGTGVNSWFYTNMSLSGAPYPYVPLPRLDTTLVFNWGGGSAMYNHSGSNTETQVNIDRNFPHEKYSGRWLGRLKAPVTGVYGFGIYSDDGVRLWINDSLKINDFTIHGLTWDTCQVNLVAGKLYDIKIEYFQDLRANVMQFAWRRPDRPNEPFYKDHKDSIQIPNIYLPKYSDTIPVNPYLTREDRVNSFRKGNHISEVDVLNPDGKRYVYGIPVYNFVQKEVSFSVDAGEGNIQAGLTSYTDAEASTRNTSGKEGYYSREEMPAYAHSFLLTGILSSDYVDVTGDGISDDDIGDAVKFSYSKTSGVANPYGWRAPYVTGKANYNEGFRSYSRDDKGHYIYGTKELWYLHTIESKTMIATFTLAPRSDQMEIDEHGNKDSSGK